MTALLCKPLPVLEALPGRAVTADTDDPCEERSGKLLEFRLPWPADIAVGGLDGISAADDVIDPRGDDAVLVFTLGGL